MAIAYNTSIVKRALQLQVDSSNIKSYPGSGTTWNDLSGNLYNATIFGTPSFSNGLFTFDGSNDYASFGNIDIVHGAFSIEVWFKGSPSQSGEYSALVSKDVSGSFGHYCMTSDINSTYVRFGFSGSLGQREVGNSAYTDLTTDAWFHYVGTWDGSSTLKLYRNNVVIATNTGATGTLTENTNNLTIGYRLSSATSFFTGSIPVVRIYDTELTAEEIEYNFEATRGRFGV